MTTHRRTRVALVDRFRLVTQVLELALSATCQPVQLPVQSLHGTSQIQSAILRRRVDVVVLGHALGGAVDDERLVEGLTAHGLRVIALAETEADRQRLARAGAAAAVLVDLGVRGVTDAIAAVTAGPVVPAGVSPVLAPVSADPRRGLLRRLDDLSRREVDVLALLVRGCPVTEIARAHVVSEMTVRSQVKSILRKLGVPSQLAAAALVDEARWEPPLADTA